MVLFLEKQFLQPAYRVLRKHVNCKYDLKSCANTDAFDYERYGLPATHFKFVNRRCDVPVMSTGVVLAAHYRHRIARDSPSDLKRRNSIRLAMIRHASGRRASCIGRGC